MPLKNSRYITLQEIEGKISPHTGYLRRELNLRKEALPFLGDVQGAAVFIGGTVEKLGAGEDWAIKKEFFPGVEVFFVYRHGDEEFPASLNALYSGSQIKKMRGEDLATVTIACANHLLRYIRETNPGKVLPEICHRV